MNVTLLIDAIVRQTTVLIAELATSGGVRAPLAHVADQVFLELARELDAQRVSRKVSADMFGMALRTYQRKVQRLQESASVRGQTLWQAVYDFIQSRDVIARRDILARFDNDEEALVRGVLADLVDSGFVFATGPSNDTSFRAATDAEIGAMAREPNDKLLTALMFRRGPKSADELRALVRWDPKALDEALDRLVRDGLVTRDDSGGSPVFRSERLLVPMGAETGWEAAVYDHYHSVVRTVCARLRGLAEGTAPDDTVGGSTYTLEVWDGHPLKDEVFATLRGLRDQLGALRQRVLAESAAAPRPTRRDGVVVYCGQFRWEIDDDEQDAS
jgi:hypothetical protein